MAKWRIVLEGDDEQELQDALDELKADGWGFADEPGEAGFRVER